jgi:hypothetical protein
MHAPNQLERFDERQIPPELASLAERDSDVRALASRCRQGTIPATLHVACGRLEDAGEDLDRGGPGAQTSYFARRRCSLNTRSV